MTTTRGYRAIEHTADEILEAWGPTRAACLEEAALGFVSLFVETPRAGMVEHREVMLDARDDDLLLVDVLDEVLFVVETQGVVPSAVRVVDEGEVIRLGFDLVPTDGLEPSGPSPKGISLSGLRLEHADGRWQAHALVDI